MNDRAHREAEWERARKRLRGAMDVVLLAVLADERDPEHYRSAIEGATQDLFAFHRAEALAAEQLAAAKEVAHAG